MTSRPPVEPLPPGEAHLWYAFVDEPGGQALSEQAWGLMSPEEQARHDRYHFEKSRTEYRVTRALARTTLARYLDVAPAALSFRAGPHGKPDPVGGGDLRFNLSNTDGLVVCLVTRGHEVGVDVEPLDRRVDAHGVAHRFFSPRETADLFALPEERHARRFLCYWTLKEAYIKACGMGLAIPLDHFSYQLDESDQIRGISFVPERDDDPRAWQFAQFELGSRHLVALAIRRGEGADVRLVQREA